MLSPRDVVIRVMQPVDEAAAIELLADAFVDFPAMHVLVGSDSSARDRLRRMFALAFEPDTQLSGLAAEADGRLVGALTYVDSPACSVMSAGRMVRFMRIIGPRIVRAVRMLGRIERHHPATPHRHLPSVAVRPELQSQGIGRQLMEVFDEGCDAIGRPAYLETIRWADPSRPSHERFYGRLGYQLSSVIPENEEWSVLTMTRPPAVRAP